MEIVVKLPQFLECVWCLVFVFLRLAGALEGLERLTGIISSNVSQKCSGGCQVMTEKQKTVTTEEATEVSM